MSVYINTQRRKMTNEQIHEYAQGGVVCLFVASHENSRDVRLSPIYFKFSSLFFLYRIAYNHTTMYNYISHV